MSVARKTRFTEAEYLALAGASEEKLEFVGGEVFSMAGGTPRHNQIATNVAGALWGALRRGPCVPYNSDQRVHVVETGLWAYPDVTLVCGAPRPSPVHADSVVNPTLIIEVLSPGTEHYDRHEKAAHYRRIPELRDYVLVAQDRRRVEHFHRIDAERWEFREYEGSGIVPLTAVGASLPLDDVYDRVDLAAPAR
ncbi:Uma2 family endonuclease [Myxococcota bacterium]|nr:Uma2 family endonuclease [Myxococcota bacterium]